jgi:hypothetical protein
MPTPAMAKVWLNLTGHVSASIGLAAQGASLEEIIAMGAAILKMLLIRNAIACRKVFSMVVVRHGLVRNSSVHVANTRIAKRAEGMEWHRMMEPVQNAPAVSLAICASFRMPPPATAKGW